MSRRIPLMKQVACYLCRAARPLSCFCENNLVLPSGKRSSTSCAAIVAFGEMGSRTERSEQVRFGSTGGQGFRGGLVIALLALFAERWWPAALARSCSSTIPLPVHETQLTEDGQGGGSARYTVSACLVCVTADRSLQSSCRRPAFSADRVFL